MPFYPMPKDSEGIPYIVYTLEEKRISEYSGLSLYDVYTKIDIVDYYMLRRDSFIYQCSQTESGIEYLKNAHRLTETKPDKEKLREKFGRKEE